MKQLLSTYSISGNTITLTGVNRPREAVLSITNASTGEILYTAQTGGATAYSQNTNSTITLSTTPGASDRLQIYYDDGVSASNAPSTVTANPATASSVTQTTGTATTSTGSTIALAANSATKQLTIQNTATSGTLYIGLGSAATTSSFQLAAGQGYDFPVVPSQAIYLLGSASVTYAILSA